MPIYYATLGPRLYGAWAASGELLAVLQAFDLGVTNILTQRVGAAHATDDHPGAARWLVAASPLLVGLAIAMTGGLLLISFGLPRLLNLRPDEARSLLPAFRLGAVAVGLFMLANPLLGFARGIQDSGAVNAAMVLGSLLGFLVTATLLLRGFGLWAPATGMLVRTGVYLTGCALFARRTLSQLGLRREARFERDRLRDLARETRATALSGIGYVAANGTEATFVAAILGPDKAAVVNATRRALDLVRGLLDTYAFSSYAGFAHLCASPDRPRARKVYGELTAAWLAIALSAAAAYLAVAPALVRVWTGRADQFAGPVVAVLMAAQMTAVGGAELLSYLYRATGPISRGAYIQFGESLVRFPLLILGLRTVGLAGPALAAIATSTAGGFLAWRGAKAELADVPWDRSRSWTAWAAAAAVLAAAIALGMARIVPPRWPAVLATGGAVFGGSLLLQLRLDARLARFAALVRRRKA